jgi:hypothetical protein
LGFQRRTKRGGIAHTVLVTMPETCIEDVSAYERP